MNKDQGKSRLHMYIQVKILLLKSDQNESLDKYVVRNSLVMKNRLLVKKFSKSNNSSGYEITQLFASHKKSKLHTPI